MEQQNEIADEARQELVVLCDKINCFDAQYACMSAEIIQVQFTFETEKEKLETQKDELKKAELAYEQIGKEYNELLALDGSNPALSPKQGELERALQEVEIQKEKVDDFKARVDAIQQIILIVNGKLEQCQQQKSELEQLKSKLELQIQSAQKEDGVE